MHRSTHVLTAVIYTWLTCSLVFTVVDFLSDGVQRNRLLNDVIVIWNLYGDVTGKEICYRLRFWSDTTRPGPEVNYYCGKSLNFPA